MASHSVKNRRIKRVSGSTSNSNTAQPFRNSNQRRLSEIMAEAAQLIQPSSCTLANASSSSSSTPANRRRNSRAALRISSQARSSVVLAEMSHRPLPPTPPQTAASASLLADGDDEDWADFISSGYKAFPMPPSWPARRQDRSSWVSSDEEREELAMASTPSASPKLHVATGSATTSRRAEVFVTPQASPQIGVAAEMAPARATNGYDDAAYCKMTPSPVMDAGQRAVYVNRHDSVSSYASSMAHSALFSSAASGVSTRPSSTAGTSECSFASSSRRKRSSSRLGPAPTTPLRSASLHHQRQFSASPTKISFPASSNVNRPLMGAWLGEEDQYCPVPVNQKRTSSHLSSNSSVPSISPRTPMQNRFPSEFHVVSSNSLGHVSTNTLAPRLQATPSPSCEEPKTVTPIAMVNGSATKSNGIRSLFRRPRRESNTDGMHLATDKEGVGAPPPSQPRESMSRSRSMANLKERLLTKMGAAASLSFEDFIGHRPVPDVPLTPSEDVSNATSPSQAIFGSAALLSVDATSSHAEGLRTFARDSNARLRTSSISLNVEAGRTSRRPSFSRAANGGSVGIFRPKTIRRGSSSILFDFDPASPLELQADHDSTAGQLLNSGTLTLGQRRSINLWR